MKAWHFVNNTLRDGRSIPNDGEWLVHEGEIEICASGLHASKSIRDALRYAPGNTLCRVECRGDIVEQDDKFVCRERKILWRIDATDLLWEASRKFALEVIHLWDAPKVVRDFLETGDESLRDAARAAGAAWAAEADARAAEGAAWDAARDAARAAGAAWAAARDAARAAEGAAWDAARDAARAAEGAAWDAAWDAARDAAGAAWAAARERQEKILLELIERHRA